MLRFVWMLIAYIFDRLKGPRERAEALFAVRRRVASQDGPRSAGREAVQSAFRLKALREALGSRFGPASACGSCTRPPSLEWPGGHCCSGNTEDLFTEDEAAALKLSGTKPRHLRSPHRTQNGCLFRGPKGCSLLPRHRPSLCIRYNCFDLQREIDMREDADEVNRLLEDLRQEAEHFVKLKNERDEARRLRTLAKALERQADMKRSRR